MSSIPASSSPVELCFTFLHGPIIREAGKSRPVSLDAIARDHGARAVDQMLEAPGQWVGIEPGPSIKQEIAAIQQQTAQIAQARQEIQQLADKPSERLPDVHPGTPGTARVRLVCRIIRRTASGALIELAEDPRGQVWVSNKHVRPGDQAHAYGCESLSFPLWLYRKLREQL